MFVRGVGERTIQLLEEAGFKSVDDVLREDEDKLAIKTGLGIKKARAIKQGAQSFLENEHKVLEQARAEAKKSMKAPAPAQPPSEGGEQAAR
jgi:N utilization substance protein A